MVTPAVTDTAGNAFDADPDSLGGQSFAASFRTDRERIAPRVLRMTLDGDPPPVDTGIRIDFSEPVDSASALAPEHFRLMSEADTLEGSRLFTADHRSVILDPADDLEYQTTYSVIVEGVVDEKGNLLDQDPDLPGEQPFSDTFTTAPPPIAPPHVMSVSPASGSLDQHPSEMRITFSVPMDPSTFTPSNPAVLHDGAHVGEIATADSITWTFTPADSLHNGVYIWTAQTSLKDIYGRSLDQDAESPGLQPYSGWFEVGKRPVVTLQGLCIDADSAAVELSGTAEGGEPDVAIAGVQWIWEDGLPPEEGCLLYTSP
ncbi:MAG: Ig-like domain-containing protein, partial [Candidatus Eisenbacteria bacterium]|nr:Ig-like domain-containing protein [Candidatus Eisenbacteria bacterium]